MALDLDNGTAAIKQNDEVKDLSHCSIQLN